MSKRNYGYLCGGMEGYSSEEMTGWRTRATEWLAFRDIKTLDPTRRVEEHEHMQDDLNIRRRIVKSDLQDIAHSTVILADMREDQPGKRWGSMAEIAHGHTKISAELRLTDTPRTRSS